MEMIENAMVVDWWWELLEKEPMYVKEKSNGAGYTEIGTGIFVSEEDAFNYALERLSQDEDLKQEFVGWFYSGSWIKEE